MDIDLLTILNTPLVFQVKEGNKLEINLSSLFSENRNINFNLNQKNIL